MSAVETQPSRAEIDAKLVSLASGAAVALGVVLTGFVLEEPAPYELYMVGLIAIWSLFGLAISRATAPLLVLLVLFNIGGLVSMTQMGALRETPLYLAVTAFLSLTAVFFAAVLEKRPGLFSVIFHAWLAAALGTGALGIAGYFGVLPGSERFTLYGRAAGGFQDPNVFGPYLVLPAIWLMHRLMVGRAASALPAAVGLAILTLAIFLSFSRGAWGLYAFSAIALCMALFISAPRNLVRARILVMGLIALFLAAIAIFAVLQIPAVMELFQTRAQLVQDYDSARLGRFARYGHGLVMALENPLGIGPLEFGHRLGEDTHNIWLKALLDYSWLGFAAFAMLIALTLAGGLRILLRDRPWQPFLLCAYIVLAGHILLGTVIDMDHWRHFYLLLGLVWGAIALERRHQRTPITPAA